jgi:excisionase family DNA binding protein
MESEKKESQLDRIEKATVLGVLAIKNVLTFEEAATYMGISKSHLYKKTMDGTACGFYKPRGKMIYFDRVELENWLLQNRIIPADEIEAKASTYVILNKGGR